MAALCVSLAYALLYNPTLTLSNAITFRHVPDATAPFSRYPRTRYSGLDRCRLPQRSSLCRQSNSTQWYGPGYPRLGHETTRLFMAAAFSTILGLYCLVLPHTPPTAHSGDTVPFLKALSLFKNFSFAVFFSVSFVITIVLAFYFTSTSAFLEQAAGVKYTNSIMLLGQVCELIFLPLLPFFLWRWGMKWVLALGMLCLGNSLRPFLPGRTGRLAL